MAALNRPKKATYEIHENVTIDTQDNEDHTFCGVMFPIKCKALLPIDHIVVKSVSVRGRLGPLTVWINNNDNDAANRDNSSTNTTTARSSASLRSNNNESRRRLTLRNVITRRNRIERWDSNTNEDEEHRRHAAADNNDQHRVKLHPKSWTKLYEKKHGPCPRHTYTELVFEKPVILRPGNVRVLYIHSTANHDQAIVYDNNNNSNTTANSCRFEDNKLAILSGRAHVSTTCFGQDPIWGWGNAWRDNREFVGRLSYGTVYRLWAPEIQPKFGTKFQNGSRALFLCQRRWESPFSKLPDDAIYYILNMCKWDWFDDNDNTMKERKKREKIKTTIAIEQEKQQQLLLDQQQTAVTAVAMSSSSLAPMDDNNDVDEEEEDSKLPARLPSCNRTRSVSNMPEAMYYESSNDEENDLNDYGMDGSSSDDDEYNDDDDDDDDDIEMNTTNEDNSDDIDDDDEDDINGSDEDIAEEVWDSDHSSENGDDWHTATRRHFSFRVADSDSDDDDDDDDEDSNNDDTTRNSRGLHRFGGQVQHRSARVRVLHAFLNMVNEVHD